MQVPEVVQVYVRFATAWAALVFAGQLPAGQTPGTLGWLRGGKAEAWWVRAELTLDIAREMVAVGSGQVYLPRGDDVVPDRGPTDQEALSSLRPVSVLDLVRVAGLHPCPARPLAEAVLLLPGYLVGSVARRIMDLGLRVSYRPVALSPLFEPDPPGQVGYELCARGDGGATLPAFLVAALSRDPFILVCRRVGETSLMRHGLASPLPDSWLVAVSNGEPRVFADAAYGCARLLPLGEARDGTSLVRRGRDHELVDVSPDASWAQAGEDPGVVTPPELSLRPARMSGVPVDAALLDDADLGCLTALLAGEPLAESAVLVRGRDRHLLTAPGGLLEQLPVGEPLYCAGPGCLYLPLGYRFKPALPRAARGELFPTSQSSAIVVLTGAALRFDLTTRVPVWTFWAGSPPRVDDQLHASAVHDLEDLDPDIARAASAPEPATDGQQASEPAGGPAQMTARPAEQHVTPPRTTRSWRDEAYQAELSGDLIVAAELHLAHDDTLRAARLYERAAEQG